MKIRITIKFKIENELKNLKITQGAFISGVSFERHFQVIIQGIPKYRALKVLKYLNEICIVTFVIMHTLSKIM